MEAALCLVQGVIDTGIQLISGQADPQSLGLDREASRFLMLDVDDKDDADDLSAKESKVPAAVAEEHRRSVLSNT